MTLHTATTNMADSWSHVSFCSTAGDLVHVDVVWLQTIRCATNKKEERKEQNDKSSNTTTEFHHLKKQLNTSRCQQLVWDLNQGDEQQQLSTAAPNLWQAVLSLISVSETDPETSWDYFRDTLSTPDKQECRVENKETCLWVCLCFYDTTETRKQETGWMLRQRAI